MTQTTILLRPPAAGLLRWESFGDQVDVHERVLWVQGRARAAVLHLRPGASVEPHRHRLDAHHVWIVEGACSFGHHLAAEGCYLFVPPGTEHGAKAGPEGCTLFYLIVPALES